MWKHLYFDALLLKSANNTVMSDRTANEVYEL